MKLPPIDQVGFVVKDIHAAIDLYTPLFGAFTLWEPTDIPDAEFRGRREGCRLHIAVAQSGDVEIELIQWLDGHSPHAEAAGAGRFGMHHLRYRVEDADAAIEQSGEAGYSLIWYKQWDANIKFGYLERQDDPLIIEFLQMPESR